MTQAIYWDHKKNEAYTKVNRGHANGHHLNVVELIPTTKNKMRQQFSDEYFEKLVKEGSLEHVTKERLLQLQLNAEKLHLH